MYKWKKKKVGTEERCEGRKEGRKERKKVFESKQHYQFS